MRRVTQFAFHGFRGLAVAAVFSLATDASAAADPIPALQDLLEGTRIMGIAEINPHDRRLAEARGGSYELSGGGLVTFDRWYQRLRPDLRLDGMSRLTDGSAILWGISTGELGSKYVVEPSIRLGLLVQTHPSPASTLSLTVTTALGGRLREKPCTADYGQIGGVQVVNCRLAASILEPKRTLDFLWRERMPDQTRVTLRYRLRF
jgi:hypothetical protein